jgi:hypothetical protein
MTYRELPYGEWQQLEPIFHDCATRLPAPGYARILVAEEDGCIVGFLVKQITAHLEPLWFSPDVRGHVHNAPDWRHMANLLGKEDTYVFTDSPARERQCERAGYVKLPYAVYVHATHPSAHLAKE